MSGVHSWTIAAVLAALVVLARWPRAAADLAPVLLAIFAARGFTIAANWQSIPPAGSAVVGYLLKDRVFNDDQFVDAIRTVAGGGTVMDPEVVTKLLGRRARDEPVARLSAREREVLGLMAEGRSNVAIAQRPFVTEKAVSKHTTSIFTKLGLTESAGDNRRVLAVLAYLNS